MFRRTILLGVLLAIGTLALPSKAILTTYGFEVIPVANLLANAATGEANLFLDVDQADPGHVSFTFRNTDPAGSGIYSIYFDDDVFGVGGCTSALALYAKTGTVWFTDVQNAAPLRGENLTPPWEWWDTDFAATTVDGAVHMVDGPAETLTVLGGGQLDEVVACLDDGRLRVAVCVLGFPDSGWETFVATGPGVPIPEPSMFLLGILGAGLSAFRRRRRG